MTLYYSPACVFCLRVLAAIKTLGLDIAKKNTWTEAGAREELQREGGSSMVPCLRIEEDNNVRWMYESSDIISYLESLAENRSQ